jgi:hypothetical protein
VKIPRIPRFSIDWPNHIIGFLSSLFGILIAFELDEWREQREKSEIAESAFEKLMQEVQINKTTLHEMATTNLTLIAGLQNKILNRLDDNLLFTGSRVQADSANNHIDLMVVVFIDTVAWRKNNHAPPAHIALGNLVQPILHLSAWESAKATGALNFMSYEKVLTLSSLYNAPRITDELNQVKNLIRSADQVKKREQLKKLLTDLKTSFAIINRELVQYDLFVSMLEQME